MDALIATILRKPSSVKCSLRSIRSNACLNNWKSALFSVFKLNLYKWSITTPNSFCKFIINWINLFPCLVIEPAVKKYLTFYKILLSFRCKPIEKKVEPPTQF